MQRSKILNHTGIKNRLWRLERSAKWIIYQDLSLQLLKHEKYITFGFSESPIREVSLFYRNCGTKNRDLQKTYRYFFFGAPMSLQKLSCGASRSFPARGKIWILENVKEEKMHLGPFLRLFCFAPTTNVLNEISPLLESPIAPYPPSGLPSQRSPPGEPAFTSRLGCPPQLPPLPSVRPAVPAEPASPLVHTAYVAHHSYLPGRPAVPAELAVPARLYFPLRLPSSQIRAETHHRREGCLRRSRQVEKRRSWETDKQGRNESRKIRWVVKSTNLGLARWSRWALRKQNKFKNKSFLNVNSNFNCWREFRNKAKMKRIELHCYWKACVKRTVRLCVGDYQESHLYRSLRPEQQYEICEQKFMSAHNFCN